MSHCEIHILWILILFCFYFHTEGNVVFWMANKPFITANQKTTHWREAIAIKRILWRTRQFLDSCCPFLSLVLYCILVIQGTTPMCSTLALKQKRKRTRKRKPIKGTRFYHMREVMHKIFSNVAWRR